MGGLGGRSVGRPRRAKQPGRTGGSAAGRHIGFYRRQAGPRSVGRGPHLERRRGGVPCRLPHRPRWRAHRPIGRNRRRRRPRSAGRVPVGAGMELRPDRLAGLGAQSGPPAFRPVLRLLSRFVRGLRSQLHRGAVRIRPARLLDRCLGSALDAGIAAGLLPALPRRGEAARATISLLVRTCRGGRGGAPCHRWRLGVGRHRRRGTVPILRNGPAGAAGLERARGGKRGVAGDPRNRRSGATVAAPLAGPGRGSRGGSVRILLRGAVRGRNRAGPESSVLGALAGGSAGGNRCRAIPLSLAGLQLGLAAGHRLLRRPRPAVGHRRGRAVRRGRAQVVARQLRPRSLAAVAVSGGSCVPSSARLAGAHAGAPGVPRALPRAAHLGGLRGRARRRDGSEPHGSLRRQPASSDPAP